MLNITQNNQADIGILILSGGQGRRLGGKDKGLVTYQGQQMVKRLIDKLEKQIAQLDFNTQIVISANRNLLLYKTLGYPVICDTRKGYQGPLAGIESALFSTQFQAIERWIICPVDTPNLPNNFLQKMLNTPQDQVSYLEDQQRAHYAHLSFPAELKGSLSTYLNQGNRSIKHWLNSLPKVTPIKLDNNHNGLENINHCHQLSSQ